MAVSAHCFADAASAQADVRNAFHQFAIPTSVYESTLAEAQVKASDIIDFIKRGLLP